MNNAARKISGGLLPLNATPILQRTAHAARRTGGLPRARHLQSAWAGI